MALRNVAVVLGAVILQLVSSPAARADCSTTVLVPSAQSSARCSATGGNSVCGSTSIVAETAELPNQVCYQVATPNGPMNNGNH